MFCGKCGSPIKDGNSFCSICGAPVDAPVMPTNGSVQESDQPITQPIQTASVTVATPQSKTTNLKNGAATAGLVVGIIALLCSLSAITQIPNSKAEIYEIVPSFMMLFVLAIPSTIFSAVGLAKSRKSGSKNKAIIALIISACSLIIFIIAIVFSFGGSIRTTNSRTINVNSNELESLLVQQPVYVGRTKYTVQDSKYKSLYPDLLQAIVVNNSEEDIKRVVVAYAAWDENNLPVKIQGYLSYSGAKYIAKCEFDGINLVPGKTYGWDSGLALDTGLNIKQFKAIVVEYETFDGTIWKNPYYSAWEKIYGGGTKLSDDMHVDVRLTDEDYAKKENSTLDLTYQSPELLTVDEEIDRQLG